MSITLEDCTEKVVRFFAQNPSINEEQYSKGILLFLGQLQGRQGGRLQAKAARILEALSNKEIGIVMPLPVEDYKPPYVFVPYIEQNVDLSLQSSAQHCNAAFKRVYDKIERLNKANPYRDQIDAKDWQSRVARMEMGVPGDEQMNPNDPNYESYLAARNSRKDTPKQK